MAGWVSPPAATPGLQRQKQALDKSPVSACFEATDHGLHHVGIGEEISGRDTLCAARRGIDRGDLRTVEEGRAPLTIDGGKLPLSRMFAAGDQQIDHLLSVVAARQQVQAERSGAGIRAMLGSHGADVGTCPGAAVAHSNGGTCGSDTEHTGRRVACSKGEGHLDDPGRGGSPLSFRCSAKIAFDKLFRSSPR
jgi:hypothetical protein